MDRIKQGIGADLSTTFEAAGVAVDPDPDTATVEVLRSDGSALIAQQPAQNDGQGMFSTHLTPDDTAQLDTLEAVWRAEFDGETDIARTRVEIAGDHYFTVSEFRGEYADLSDVDAAKIAKKRKAAEDRIEKAVNFAGVRRAKRIPFSGAGRFDLVVPVRYLRGVISGSIGADPLDLATVVVGAMAVVRTPAWPRGDGNISLLVEHGLDSPPEALKEAAMMLTAHLLRPTPLDERTTAIQNLDGRTELLATPGRHGSLTGVPEIDVRISDEALDPISWLAVR